MKTRAMIEGRKVPTRDSAGTMWPTDVLRLMASAETMHRLRTRPHGCLTEAEAAIKLLNAAVYNRKATGTIDADHARKALFEAADAFAKAEEYWRNGE